MGLERTPLDDRTHAELMTDLRRQIPVRAPLWTDHNAHDPGITILELLAWLAETYTYQLDQVTDDHRRKYLRLLDVVPHPPTPATGEVTIEPPETLAGAHLPAGLALVAVDDDGTETWFETTEPAAVTATQLRRVVSEHRDGRIDNTVANGTAGLGYLAFGADAEVGSALYLGFDTDPFDATGVLDLSIVLDDEGVPDPATHGDEPDTFQPSARVRWQYCTTPAEWFRSTAWADVEVRHDGTRALYESGVVSMAAPSTWPGAIGILNQEEAFHWLRCVVSTAGHEVPPRVDAVRLNRQRIRHGRRVGRTVLTRADGARETSAEPGQTFRFTEPDQTVQFRPLPVLDAFGTLDLDVGGDAWTEVRDFDGSGPEDHHYVVDRATGEVRFGDERRGAAPEAGQQVVVRGYTTGGGVGGNLPSGLHWRFTETSTESGELDTLGVYRFSSPERGFTGAVVVGADVPFEDSELPAPEDRLGEEEVTVVVGTTDNGDPAFSPPVVRVDPGTSVRFVWASDGHSLVVDDQPSGGVWGGQPTPRDAGSEHRYRFQPPLPLDSLHVGGTETTGGTDAESVDEALLRLREDLRTPYRAVTAADYAAVATSTPGLRFGRAMAVSPDADEGRDETDDCVRLPAIRVVVVPYSTRSRPTPSDGFRRAVERHLSTHRLLTDRVTVVPATYVDVSVTATLRLRPGAAAAETEAAVETAIDAFLDPLTGFEGEGWPFGRSLYRSEMYAVVESVSGVDCVLDLTLSARGDVDVGTDGEIGIPKTGLFAPLDHSLSVRSDRDRCKGGF